MINCLRDSIILAIFVLVIKKRRLQCAGGRLGRVAKRTNKLFKNKLKKERNKNLWQVK